jgi:DMSO/TMAO reductase YedYZ heme-binding membrane subunit
LPRHAKIVDRRARTTRLSTVTLVWVCGLAAGFFGLLAAAARYGCGADDNGFACRTSGSAVGVLILIGVVAVVTAVTVLTHNRPPRRVLAIGGVGIVGLALCLVCARMLLGTV